VLGGLALVGGTVATVAPAHADSPASSVVVDDGWTIRADGTHELAAFINISRASFCTDAEVAAENAFLEWLAGGQLGDPPNDYPFVPGAVPLTMKVQDVGLTSQRGSATATVPVELWTFEAGKSWAAGNLVSPCVDTDGIVDLTSTRVAPGGLLASGTGTYTLRDNSLTGEGQRTNVWSESLSADLTGSGSGWWFTYTQSNQARHGEYLKGSTTFRLQPR
jgi:hypothetical protein